MRWLLVLGFATACGAPAQPAAITPKPRPHDPYLCEEARPRVWNLYRADAEQHEPKRADDAARDNTQMAMNDCAKDTRVGSCLLHAQTVDEIERHCLIPLDPDGREGDALK